jgi:predicted  nucleic acid-binding Zn-ribbon protein
MNLDHLRLQLDDLEHRAEDTRDPMEWRRIIVECTALERSIVTVEEEMERNIAMLEAIRKRLRRLRARA